MQLDILRPQMTSLLDMGQEMSVPTLLRYQRTAAPSSSEMFGFLGFAHRRTDFAGRVIPSRGTMVDDLDTPRAPFSLLRRINDVAWFDGRTDLDFSGCLSDSSRLHTFSATRKPLLPARTAGCPTLRSAERTFSEEKPYEPPRRIRTLPSGHASNDDELVRIIVSCYSHLKSEICGGKLAKCIILRCQIPGH